MKTCDCCGKTKDTKDFCDAVCKMRYRRVTDKSELLPASNKDDADMLPESNENETPALQNVIKDNSDEYIIPTAPCWQCTHLVQWDDEVEGYKCKKCKTVTRLKAE